MKKSKPTSQVKLKGSKKDGWTISVKAGRYEDDIQLSHEEIQKLQTLLNKKIKWTNTG